MSNAILILSGYNIRAVLAFCRWAESRQVPFHLIASNPDDPIFLTKFRQNVALTRDSEKLDVLTVTSWISLLRTKHDYQQVLLLPSTEFFNRFMLANRATLETAGGIVPLVARNLYERISDKYSFGKMCMDAGIPVPEEFPLLPTTFPFVAKPKNYASISRRQLKPYLIHCAEDLLKFQKNELADDYYYQQFIAGRSLYLLANLQNDGKSVLFSQENLMQQKNGGSVILARGHCFHRTKAAHDYINLLVNANFHGLIMIEVRYHEQSQQYYMIEANPRLWGPMQLLVDHGIDIIGSFLRNHNIRVAEKAEPVHEDRFYFWSGGLADHGAPDFHNYSPALFIRDFHAIMRANLFLREDSMPLYRHELFTPH